MTTAVDVLVVYYSRKGHTADLARQVVRGIEQTGAGATLRTVPPLSPVSEAVEPPVPDDGPPYAELDDLRRCDALVIGSPTRFGNMAAPLKYFLDTTSALWLGGDLAGKPAAVFTTSSSLHGGQESTLLTMALPLIHHGMLYVGLPYTEKALFDTETGGSPYGATRITADWAEGFSKDEKALAQALGKRVAEIARRLKTA